MTSIWLSKHIAGELDARKDTYFRILKPINWPAGLIVSGCVRYRADAAGGRPALGADQAGYVQVKWLLRVVSAHGHSDLGKDNVVMRIAVILRCSVTQ